MGYDLSNAAGAYARFTGSGWDLALAVARHYGWEPAGMPQPPEWDEKRHGPWEDGYWMNAGQEVTADDATALTNALVLATSASDLTDIVHRLGQPMTDLSLDDAARFRARLVEFAALARQGPFRI